MLKKLLVVLAILFPSALYLYIVNKDQNTTSKTEQTQPNTTSQPQYQTPDK